MTSAFAAGQEALGAPLNLVFCLGWVASLTLVPTTQPVPQ